MSKINSGLITISSILILLMFLSFFKVVDFSLFIILGDIFLLSSLIFILLVFLVQIDKFSKINKDVFYIILPLLSIAIIYFINIFFTISPLISLQRSFLIFLISIAFVFFYKVGYLDKNQLVKRNLFWLLSLIVFSLILFYIMRPEFTSAKLFFLNPNAFGMYMSLLFISMMAVGPKKIRLIIFFIGLFFVFISSSRNSLLAYVGSYIFLSYGHIFYKSKKIYLSIILSLILLSMGIIYFMVYIDLSQYNELVRDYSNKNLMSGRNEVWPFVLDLIKEKPYLGWGGGITLADVSFYNFSSHNMYLHTALQVGILGVLLIYLFYFNLWRSLWALKENNNEIHKVNALFIWLIWIQNFEVTLLQNNLAMSVPVICLIAYFMGVSKFKINESSF